jgi:hypothetical protein
MSPSGAAAGRNRVVDSLTLLAMGAAAIVICHDASVEARWWVVAYVLAIIVIVRTASLGFHELGHLLAASVAGWRWDVFKIGPLLLSRESGVLRASLRGARRFKAAGLVLTRPASREVDTKARHILMLSGGPTASALLSLLAWAAWRAVDSPLPRIALGVTAAFSAIVFVTTLLPFVSSGNLSDGATILSLLRERAGSKPEHAR